MTKKLYFKQSEECNLREIAILHFIFVTTPQKLENMLRLCNENQKLLQAVLVLEYKKRNYTKMLH